MLYTNRELITCFYLFPRLRATAARYDETNHKTPPGTMYNVATQLLLDVYDCQNLLAFWPWVTDGCDGNKGFYFNFSTDGSHHLEAATSTSNNCVQVGWYDLNRLLFHYTSN